MNQEQSHYQEGDSQNQGRQPFDSRITTSHLLDGTLSSQGNQPLNYNEGLLDLSHSSEQQLLLPDGKPQNQLQEDRKSVV